MSLGLVGGLEVVGSCDRTATGIYTGKFVLLKTPGIEIPGVLGMGLSDGVGLGGMGFSV